MGNVKHKDVFIRVGGSVSIADAVAHLEGLGYKNCWSERFYPPPTTASISGDEDGIIGWCKLPNWCEENDYQEILIPPTKHKHYDLIVKWAADQSQKVWYQDDCGGWFVVNIPCWNEEVRYHVGEHPPKRKIMIGDVEVDAPEICEIPHDTEYYLPNPSSPEFYSCSRWHRDSIDLFRLKTGVIHLNKEAAIAHAKALIKVSGGCVDE